MTGLTNPVLLPHQLGMGLPITGIPLPLLLPQLLSTALSISSLFLPRLLWTALSISSLGLPHLLPMGLPISLLTRQDPFPIGFIVPPVFLPYALEVLLSVTPVGLRPLGSMRFPVALVGLRSIVIRPQGSTRCLAGLLGCRRGCRGCRRPGSWPRSGRWWWWFVILTFAVPDGGSAGAQLSLGRPEAQGAMREPVAVVSCCCCCCCFPLGSLGPFEYSNAFSPLVGDCAGTQFSCGTHRETGAVPVEGWQAF